MANKFYQYGDVFLTDIKNTVTNYFRTAKAKHIEIPDNINPLVYDSLRYKIMLPKHLAYNKSFTDIIDPANTPENNNVNVINELNVCVSVEGGVMIYHCYKYPSGEKISLPYMEYLNSAVLSNECYDYENKEVLKLDSYKYKKRLKTYNVKNLKDAEIQLIEPAPDERLSLTTRRIPMINNSDSVRVAMGCAMSKQSIEVYSSEPPLVTSGNDDQDFISSSNIVRYEGLSDAEVAGMKDDLIYLKTKEGSILPIQIPSPTVGANKAMITFEATVKKGDKVKVGDTLVLPKLMRNGTHDLGTNARVFYMHYLGYTYEDGVVISESYANKMAHYSSIEVTLAVKSSDIIRYIAKIGTKVKSRDILLNRQSRLKVNKNTREFLEGDTSISASVPITASFTGSFTGSLFGTASSATTASWGISSSVSLSSSAALTSSWAITASVARSSSAALTSSWAITSSVAISVTSASWSSASLSASWAPSSAPTSASWASRSFAATSASWASASLTSLTSTTATSASWASASLIASQSVLSLFSYTADFALDSEFCVSASYALSYSVITNYETQSIVSASFADFASASISASYAQTASFALNAGGVGGVDIIQMRMFL
jgi:biotin carboxyl carrier protein